MLKRLEPYQQSIYLALLVLVPTLILWPTLDNDFINWDDDVLIVENYTLQNLSSANLAKVVQDNTVESFAFLNWMLDYQWFGHNPLAYHWGNLLLHLINTLLVFWLVSLLVKQRIVAFATALLFAIHPMHVEPVAWATGRTHLWYACFMFLSLIAYSKYVLQGSKVAYLIMAILTCCLALFSFPSAIALAPALFLIDYWLERKWSKRLLWDKLPFFAATALAGVFILTARGGEMASSVHFSLLERVAIASHNSIWYLYKGLVPFNLTGFYPYPTTKGALEGWLYVFIPIALALVALWVWSFRRYKVLFFALGFYFVNIFPVLRLFAVEGEYMMADRYAYMAFTGLFMALAIGMFRMVNSKRIRPMVAVLVLSVYFGLCGWLSWERGDKWQDSIAFWSDVATHYPQTPFAYNNRANAYVKANLETPAMQDLNNAITIDPNFHYAYNSRGELHRKQGNLAKAEADLDQALKIYPNYHIARNNRAIVYRSTNRTAQALQELEQIIQRHPDYLPAYFNRAGCQYDLGQFQDALKDYNFVLQQMPNNANACVNRALVWEAMGQDQKALTDYERALQIQPTHLEAFNNRGDHYLKQKQYTLAVQDFAKVIEMEPNKSRGYYNMGLVYYDSQKYDKAYEFFDHAVKRDPKHLQALTNMGAILQMQQDTAAALAKYDQVLALDPGFFQAALNKGMLLAELSQHEAAIPYFDKAIFSHPSSGMAYYYRSWSYHELGKRQAALKDALQAQTLGIKVDTDYLEQLQ